MSDGELLTVIGAGVPSLVMVAMTAWMRTSIDKIDQINIIATKLDAVIEKLARYEERFDKHDKTRDEMILQKAEMKAQWDKIEDVRKQVRGLYGQ